MSFAGALRRLPYLGGPTFLGKALSFAAGVLYQEQNMKTVRRRQRALPTPRHDRPQVMLVVSDGISDDQFAGEATQLQERMQVSPGEDLNRTCWDYGPIFLLFLQNK